MCIKLIRAIVVALLLGALPLALYGEERPKAFVSLSVQGECLTGEREGDILPIYSEYKTIIWPCVEGGVYLGRFVRLGGQAGPCLMWAESETLKGVSFAPYIQGVVPFFEGTLHWTPTAGVLFDTGKRVKDGIKSQYGGTGLFAHPFSLEIRLTDGLYFGWDCGFIGWSMSDWEDHDERTAFDLDFKPNIGVVLGGLRFRIIRLF